MGTAKKKTASAPAKSSPTKSKSSPGPAKSTADGLLDAYWENPDDRDALRVWADALQEAGDPRGEFIQMSLLENKTPDQELKRDQYMRKHGGKLVGPAREYLREWAFGDDGLVVRARLEADKLAAGIEHIERLNPRLSISLTSTKKKSVIDELAKVSLERIHYVSLTQSVMGSHGGAELSDKSLRALIPSFKKVKNLHLSCRGRAKDCFSADALRALGDQLDGIEYFGIEYVSLPDDPLPPLSAYIDAIVQAKGFRTLKSLAVLYGVTDAMRLALTKALPNLVTLTTDDHYGGPNDAADLVDLKTKK
jgi:uncharacterized protein (TIGR02996 family)